MVEVAGGDKSAPELAPVAEGVVVVVGGGIPNVELARDAVGVEGKTVVVAVEGGMSGRAEEVPWREGGRDIGLRWECFSENISGL